MLRTKTGNPMFMLGMAALAAGATNARAMSTAEVDKNVKDVLDRTPAVIATGPFQADWESLAKHKDPVWFDDAKFGIYFHWGVYSVPAFGNEWYARWMYSDQDARKRGNYYQYHLQTYGPPEKFGYKDLIPLFKAEKFNADEWAKLFQDAGAKFAGPCGEHHDGFSMWDSAVTEWDAAEKGPKRDLVGELEKAIRKRGLKYLVSMHHGRNWWFFEHAWTPEAKYDFQDPRYFGLYSEPHPPEAPPTERYMNIWRAKLLEVIDRYQPDLLWFDGCMGGERFFRSSAPAMEKHKKQFIAYYYNQAHKWGREVAVTYKGDQLPKGVGIFDIERGREGKLTDYKWLTDTSVDLRSWSYIANPDYKSVDTLVDELVDIVSKNGNMLLNIGPRADGTIPEEQRQILLGIGRWLKVNGEAIYGTRPWRVYGEGPTETPAGGFTDGKFQGYTKDDIRFTTKGDMLYVICLAWPGGPFTVKSLAEGSALADRQITALSLVGSDAKIQWTRNSGGLTIHPPAQQPCEHAFVFRAGFR